MTQSNGFDNKKSLSEQINDIVMGNDSRRNKVQALIKLGIQENEIRFILPVEQRTATPRFTFTFGVEIECVMPRDRFETAANMTGVSYHFEGYNHTDNREYFKFVTDSSICRSSRREGDPIECVSPVLEGTKAGFDKLSACCAALETAGAYVNKSTGLHVHIGAAGLTDEQYINVFKNYKALEAIIDTFMAPSRRRDNNTFCKSLQGYNFDYACNTIADLQRKLSSRYYKVNPMSIRRHGTIEFRQHQGTTDFEKISNWVRFVAKLVEWSAKNVLNRTITTIDEIPFITESEIQFFKARAVALR
jgi:hypothetical protein